MRSIFHSSIYISCIRFTEAESYRNFEMIPENLNTMGGYLLGDADSMIIVFMYILLLRLYDQLNGQGMDNHRRTAVLLR